MMKKEKKIGLFIMPRNSNAWKGSEALWITVGGWAAAAERRLGKAYVLTTDRFATPREVLKYPLGKTEIKPNSLKKKISSWVPDFFTIFIKDIALFNSSVRKTNYSYKLPEFTENISFVWEQHDFFPGIGYRLSKKYGVPFIIYVHAPQVWEASKWGVKRPIWGRFLENLETRSLKKADVVACVSQQVAEKLISMGIPEEKILISPMAVDPNLFADVDTQYILDKYDLKNKFVIGWTGSFRSFHGLDLLLEVFKKVLEVVEEARLLLVGDGFEKERIFSMAQTLGIGDKVIFTGRKTFTEIPAFVKTFHLAIVSTGKANNFHYSPLKLREYLGAGIATLAPNAGEIPDMFKDDYHLTLYKIGDIEGIAEKLIELYHNSNKRNFIAKKGNEYILKNGTWSVELDKLLDKLNK